MVVTSLHIYPVKSLAGLSVPEGEVEPWGLRHDRRWLVLSPDGGVLTARERPQMLSICATPLDEGAIELTGRGNSAVVVEPPVDGEPLTTALSRLESVRTAGREADVWLSLPSWASRFDSGGSTILVGEPCPQSTEAEKAICSVSPTPVLCF